MANQWMILILLAALVAVSTAGIIARDKEGDSSSSEESQELAEFLGSVQSECLQKTGSNETYEKLVESSMTIPLCVMSKVDAEYFSNDLENLSESTRVEFFSKYCPQIHESLSCLEPATEQLRKCLDPEEIELLDIVVNMLPEGLNLACKNNGEIFFMDDSNFDECADKFSDYISKCADKISNTTEAMDLSSYGPKQCDEVAQVRQCMEQKMVDCKAPKLMDLFDLFYRPVVKASPCKDHISLNELSQIESNAI